MSFTNPRHTPLFDPEDALTSSELAFIQDLSSAASSDATAVPIISTGTSAPTTTPSVVGDIFVDTTNNTVYIATGIASSADWKELGAGGGYTNLTSFVDQTAWRVFYSNGLGDVTELALGASGTFLKSNGATSAPTFAVPAGTGDVSKVGIPADNQIGVWTGDGTIEGDTALTFNTTTDTLTTGILNSTSLTASQIIITDASKNIVSAPVATYPSLTELTYVKGVTSAIQTQLGTKAPTTSPTFATSITGSYLTASQIVITNASKNIVSAPIATYPSLTELTYLKGVTSAIQTQLNAKASTLSGTINEIAYFNSSSSIASLAVATYPSLTELTYVKGVSSAIQTQITAKMTNPMTTGGDIIYGGASGAPTRLANGTAGQVLQSNGTTLAPSWVAAGAGDMVLASVQTVTGLKTFDTTKIAVKGSSTGSTAIASANTSATDYTLTLPAVTGTLVTGGGTASGTNTGDQTSIVGITGTKAQFNTAVTDGDIMYVGDAPTSHTHLLAVGATDVTASASEVNILDGATLTVTELNYVDGVTSAIQTQLDTKVSATSTNTLTNKRITPRTGTTTSSATPTINTDNVDEYYITAQAVDITSMTTNLSGTPTLGQLLYISIKGTAARAITWGASFANGAVALPTTTTTTLEPMTLFKWNGTAWTAMATGSTV